MIAGRNTSSLESRRTKPCICPERPTALISSLDDCDKTSRTTVIVACHQSSGSCSAHPVRVETKGTCSAVAEATTLPSGSITTARVPPVPTSMPKVFIYCFRFEESLLAHIVGVDKANFGEWVSLKGLLRFSNFPEA